jgi:hypothetical protein
MYIAAAYADPFVSDLVESRQKSWIGMRDYLIWQSTNEHAILKMVNEIFMEQVKESAKRLEKALREGKLDNSKANQGQAFLDVSKNFTTPLIEALEALEAEPSVGDSFRRIYSPEYLEPIIRLEAMIDARIDKALARLVSLQEYKRVRATYSPPLIPVAAFTPLRQPKRGEKWNNNYGERFFEMNLLPVTAARHRPTSLNTNPGRPQRYLLDAAGHAPARMKGPRRSGAKCLPIAPSWAQHHDSTVPPALRRTFVRRHDLMFDHHAASASLDLPRASPQEPMLCVARHPHSA